MLLTLGKPFPPDFSGDSTFPVSFERSWATVKYLYCIRMRTQDIGSSSSPSRVLEQNKFYCL